MKVGLVCHAFKHGGGMERYARDLAMGLVRRGLRPVVYAREFDASIEAYQHIKPVCINAGWMPKKLKDVYFHHQSGKRKRGVDLLIACTPARRSSIAICGGNHLGYMAATAGRRRRLSDRLKISLDRSGYQHAERIVAHSLRMRDELKRFYGVENRRIEVVYPPVDTGRFTVVTSEQRRQARERFGFKHDEVVFVLPSTSHFRKGLDILMDAFSRTSLPVVLAVAGKKFSSSDRRIRSLGYINDIEALYHAADHTVVASRYEPFGLVGVESVLCGTPVLLAENVGCREVLEDGAYTDFSLDDKGSLNLAIETAVAQIQSGEAIDIRDPFKALSYNPSIDSHIESLFAVLK